MKANNKYKEKLPPIRVLLVDAADIYYSFKYQGVVYEIKNGKRFDKHFKDLMSLNLDLYYLLEQDKIKLEALGNEFFTYDLINVSFEYNLYVDESDNRVYKKNNGVKEKSLTNKELRKIFYLEGFYLNGKHYVRYKRSAGSAKEGHCLFIKKELYPMMNKWSKAGLDESSSGDDCFNNLTSYEAYRALSLSDLITTFKLNPYNILFVEDFKYVMKNQKVVRVRDDGKHGLTASEEICDIENNIFDGEGLLDITIFKQNIERDGHHKGMALLRNRFFKCCAFNTNLQAWFAHNNITSVDQLRGFTFAERIEDIVFVVSSSCLKYFKLAKEGFSKETVKRWCDAVSNEKNLSRFGVVKTDKETRFFDGDMVETTYQMLNTLQISYTECSDLLKDHIDYITKIRNIKDTPEYLRLYLEGEINYVRDDDLDYYDDSEDQYDTEDFFDFNKYTFKSQVCFDLMKTNKDFINTGLFKNHIYTDVINNFRMRLYKGRVLVNGTYATLFGNPLEYLKYIIKKDGKYLFDHDNAASTLGANEIYCPFFKNGEEIVASRAPHVTMSNLLYAKNKHLKDVDTWFNLTRNIVVVDAINNNIQQRLNGADYDSDSMLLTNNSLLVEKTKLNYNKFFVPFSDVDYDDKKLVKCSQNNKENVILNQYEIDSQIAENKTGQIVNLSQRLNSHLWNKLNSNKRFDYSELFNNIAILAVLAGVEIDSAKRSFTCETQEVLNSVRQYAKSHGYEQKPAFFFLINPDSGKEPPRINEINSALSQENLKFLSTTMDQLWKYANGQITGPDLDHIPFINFLSKNIKTKGLGSTNYAQINRALIALRNSSIIINEESQNRNTKIGISIRDFNSEIESCYEEIKKCIADIRKTKVLIDMIIDLPDNKRIKKGEKYEYEPSKYRLLYILLFIISIRSHELGYDYKDLFKYDGGIPGLERTKNKKARFVLFNQYYYEHSLIDKIAKGLHTLKAE